MVADQGAGVNAYGWWTLVVVHSLIFIAFAFSFTHPRTARDWRSFGAFSAFIVALFTEMYGFPLTIYLLSGWLGQRYPGVDLLSHESGHLWHTLLGWKGNPHLDPLHLLSNALIFGGFILLSASWRVLYRAQRESTVARTGPYARIRHPQSVAFVLIMSGFLLQWPTLPTLLMFPILVVMYLRLSAARGARLALRGDVRAIRAADARLLPAPRGSGGGQRRVREPYSWPLHNLFQRRWGSEGAASEGRS